MKILIKLLLLFGLTFYLLFAFTHITDKGSDTVCSSVEMAIVDSMHAGFITEKEVDHILKSSGLYPIGRLMDSISSKQIEEQLTKNPFIKSAVCYKTPGGRVNIIITQRLPVMRIMADNGDDYYIDDNGYTMAPGNYVADLTIATGNIDKKFTRKHLVRLGKHLRAFDFWNNQIEQIHITADQKMELVPRVGDHIIYIGRPVNLQRKLDNLEKFYRKVMPAVGWNKYSRINLEFENQIICTKNKN